MANSSLPASLTKKGDKINIEISKDQLESFMNACGFFRRDFLNILKKSEKDHRAGRITKRKTLKELIKS